MKLKGAMLCTPVTKQVTSTDAPAITYDGQKLTDDRICYKVKCPVATLANPQVLDQFGIRGIAKLKTTSSLICTPADIL